MKIQVLSRELIKPYAPTPMNLQNYSISLVDEVCPAINIPTLLYYSNNVATENATITNEIRCKHLKMSFAKALTRFYPLAGRYVIEKYMVDCNDQGAEFVEAKVDVRLDDLIGQKKSLKVELLNLLLLRPLDAVDGVTDPLLAVQVSVFAGGGYAIGVLNSHRVSDMSTTSMFLMEWAHHAKRLSEGFGYENQLPIMSPSWNTPLLFPAKKCFRLSAEIPTPKENQIIAKMFFFSESAITRIREKASLEYSSGDQRLPTRVQSVFGLIAKAIIDIFIASPGTSRKFSIFQTVNMRERSDPPILKNQCGNLFLLAMGQSMTGEGGEVHLQSIVDLLTRSVKTEVEKCKTMLSDGDQGRTIIPNGFIGFVKTQVEPDLSGGAILFSDWCKFPFYEADFGWGKPVWVSSTNVYLRNHVFLLSDKSGQGIEAWVNLDVNDMPKFEQDSKIMEFTT